MREAVERCGIDLSGAVVLTEAASGPYAVTPVLAALAGAERVHALTRTTRYGTAEEIAEQTARLARLAGVAEKIAVSGRKRAELVAQADVVTNSGHVRPIDAETVSWMKPTAVVSLMYEAWELRPGEVDLDACRCRGIRVAGTNERHPHVDVLSYLGVMAVKLLVDAGIAVYRSRTSVVCDNPFAPFLVTGLQSAGAAVELVGHIAQAKAENADAILVAASPCPGAIIDASEADRIAARWPGVTVVQLWGDLDRAALDAAGVPYWPVQAPARGHMGLLPSAVGPEPVVRLQAGGLKVGEVLLRAREGEPGWEYVDAL
jgi:hypothetical protein